MGSPAKQAQPIGLCLCRGAPYAQALRQHTRREAVAQRTAGAALQPARQVALSRQSIKGCVLLTNYHSRLVPSQTLTVTLDEEGTANIPPMLQRFQCTKERVQGLWRTAHSGWSHHLQTTGHKGGCLACCTSSMLAGHGVRHKTRQVLVWCNTENDSAPDHAVACWGWRGHGQGFHTLCKTAWRCRLPGVKVHPQGV